ncbi:MAG TPA: hypothetical protein VIT91_13595 [Chthoniobacterales bacterium]
MESAYRSWFARVAVCSLVFLTHPLAVHSQPEMEESPVPRASAVSSPAAPVAPVPPASAQPSETPDLDSPVAPAVPDLTQIERDNAVRADELFIPTPGEFFAAITREGRPNWSLYYRKPIPMSYGNRVQAALNLGGLIGDGYIAVEAHDGQQVKNVGQDIVKLARSLAVNDDVLSRGKSITDKAEENEWNALKEELEATQNEVRAAMGAMEDQNLVIMVNVGGWIRGTEVASGIIAQNYNPQQARLLRQPALVGFMCRKIDELPENLRNDSLLKEIRLQLGEIQKIVAYPLDHAPDAADVAKLHDTVARLITRISAPPQLTPKEAAK